ncbi:MAG: hypothetical protein IKU08_00725 [Clostridia bacterium]|nr:hypothetical protein [Clostridia bacterium]
MAKKPKIVKEFSSLIINRKNRSLETRRLCTIINNGKFGLAEKYKNGNLAILIDCKYDYIDAFCCRQNTSNVVGVLQNGRWGLYSFKYTVSSKNKKIDCRQVAKCEYDYISATVKYFSCVAVLHKRKNKLKRYYNFSSDRLSQYYEEIIPSNEHYFICISNKNIQWIDIQSDTVIYNQYASAKKITEDIYLFIKYDSFESAEEKSDLVFFNRKLRVTYIIEDIDCLNITRNGLEQWEDNYIFTFRKDGDKHIISVHNDEWDIESVKAIAKEVEYT